MTGSGPGSATQTGRTAAESFSTLLEISLESNPCHPTHYNWVKGLYWSQSAKKNNCACIWLVMSSKLEMIFFACRNQHWVSSRIFSIKLWIAQVEYQGIQGQTRYAGILDCRPFIITCYHIGHKLELKYFLFTQFLLNAHDRATAHQSRKCENWELEM